MVTSYILALFLFSVSQIYAVHQCMYDQGDVHFCNNLNVENADSKNETVFTVKIPNHARKFFMARMDGSELVDSLVMNREDFKDIRMPPVGSDAELKSMQGCPVNPNDFDLYRFIDLGDRKIHIGSWYVLCAEFDVIEDLPSDTADSDDDYLFPRDGIPHRFPRDGLWAREFGIASCKSDEHKCRRCRMVRAHDTSSFSLERFLHYDWIHDDSAFADNRGATLLRLFTSADMPFPALKIMGSVVDVQRGVELFRFNRLIKPTQRIFVRVPYDAGYLPVPYAVIIDVLPMDKNGTEFKIHDSSLVLIDYLDSKIGERRRGSLDNHGDGHDDDRKAFDQTSATYENRKATTDTKSGIKTNKKPRSIITDKKSKK